MLPQIFHDPLEPGNMRVMHAAVKARIEEAPNTPLRQNILQKGASSLRSEMPILKLPVKNACGDRYCQQ